MFDIGFSELVLVALLALLVLGPKRLPEVARTAGKLLGQVRRWITDVKLDFDRELRGEELAEFRKLKEELDETRRLIENQASRTIAGIVEEAPKSEAKPRTENTLPAVEKTTQTEPAPAAPAPAKPRATAKHAKSSQHVKKAASRKKHGRAGKSRKS